MADKVDTITLKNAVEIPVWKMVWAAEPTREIDVRMSYADLKAICDWIAEARKENGWDDFC